MTFDDAEFSVNDGKRVELYWFSIGSTNYRYCTNDKPYEYLSNTYQPLAIKSSNRKVSTRIEDARRKITIPRNCALAKRVLRPPFPQELRLVVYQVHDGHDGHRINFNGYVLGGKQSGSEMVLTCQSVIAALNITGLGLRVGRGCSNVLYGPRCGINRGDYLVLGTVTAVNGRNVTVSGLAVSDGVYNGGYVEWSSAVDSATQSVTIVEQVGSVITLLSVPGTLEVGATINLYRGCDQTIATCESVFNNVNNYLGAPYRPDRSPGNGTTLF